MSIISFRFRDDEFDYEPPEGQGHGDRLVSLLISEAVFLGLPLHQLPEHHHAQPKNFEVIGCWGCGRRLMRRIGRQVREGERFVCSFTCLQKDPPCHCPGDWARLGRRRKISKKFLWRLRMSERITLNMLLTLGNQHGRGVYDPTDILYVKDYVTPFLPYRDSTIELWRDGPSVGIKGIYWNSGGAVSIDLKGCIVDPDEMTERSIILGSSWHNYHWVWRTSDHHGDPFPIEKFTHAGWRPFDSHLTSVPYGEESA